MGCRTMDEEKVTGSARMERTSRYRATVHQSTSARRSTGASALAQAKNR